MDLLKTKIYIDKLTREFNRLSKDPENIARIDVDIMRSYVLDLYEAVLSDQQEASAPEPVHPPKRSAAAHRITEPIAPAAQAPRHQAKPAAAPEPEPIPEPIQPTIEAPVVAPAPTFTAPPEPRHHGGSDLLYEEKKARELSEKLSDLPISDLKKAIGVNDRLLFTRELFSGDGQAFEATVLALNGFGSFEQAKSYLDENCVIQYGWLDKKRVEEAKNFIRLVRRRYKS